WRSRTPGKRASGQAPNEVLVRLLRAWQDQPEERALRYLLALLLVRRRVLRVEQPTLADGFTDKAPPDKASALRLYCPRTDSSYTVDIAEPGRDEGATLQQRLASLIENGEGPSATPVGAPLRRAA
ncbi:MAG: hypothetical protein ACRCT8_12330, partial [Lacipirellulaceae bacterium]